MKNVRNNNRNYRYNGLHSFYRDISDNVLQSKIKAGEHRLSCKSKGVIIIELWKHEAIKDLKRFGYLAESIKSSKEEIEDINAMLEGGGYSMSSTPVQGGGSKLEDKYNNCIVRKDRLQQLVEQNEKDYTRIKTALEHLSDDERKILRIAYIEHPENRAKPVMRAFCIEQTQAYHYIDKALKEYILARYGVKY